MKPLLRWAGGKTRLLPELVKRLPEDWRERTYVEPFLGGGALFFHLLPKRAVLNDANADLMSMYDRVAHGHEALQKELERLEGFKNLPGHYEEVRRLFNSNLASPLVQRAYFIYLNRTCFNGLWRVNKRGEFNVPYGKIKNPQIAIDLAPYAAALKGATLLSGDYRRALFGYAPAFIYADPPYDGDTHQSYTAGGFDRRQQEILELSLRNARICGAKVMLSNSDTPFIRDLYKSWNIHEVEVRRSVGAKASSRGKVKELIITSY